ncbi:MAG: zinc ABC transporter substrate-binding protein [Planctomycetes bacterium]|nr:zinc ABC transporter substrate-binding protein [Planctomycetota bacterium]
MNPPLATGRLAGLAAFAALAVAAPAVAQDPGRVLATTPNLAALCRAVGGDAIEVTCPCRAGDDPHFVEARPSMIRAAHSTELLVEVGRELEVGWLPLLVEQGRNGAILAGSRGRFVAASHVRALRVPPPNADRSAGDVHRGGNPHFLTDPLCGLQVARALRDRFAELWPARRATFDANFESFSRRLTAAMVGDELAAAYGYDGEKLALLFGAGKLAALLRAQGDLDDLGGWFGKCLALRGTPVVSDHDLWPYFAERFGVDVIAYFEPKPGIPPTTDHLAEVVATMRARKAKAILSAPYFSPRHARFVADATGAGVAAMAHQVGARPDTDDYIAMIDHDVAALVAAVAAAKTDGD